MTSGEIIVVIAAVGTMLVSVVNAVSAGWGRQTTRDAHRDLIKRSQQSDRKLDEIHTLTNGNLSKVNKQLADALERIARLETLLQDALLAKERAQGTDPQR